MGSLRVSLVALIVGGCSRLNPTFEGDANTGSTMGPGKTSLSRGEQGTSVGYTTWTDGSDAGTTGASATISSGPGETAAAVTTGWEPTSGVEFTTGTGESSTTGQVVLRDCCVPSDMQTTCDGEIRRLVCDAGLTDCCGDGPTSWGQHCVNAAVLMDRCSADTVTEPLSCCVPSGASACVGGDGNARWHDISCVENLMMSNACREAWTSDCVDVATNTCGLTCGDCCTAHEGRGCADSATVMDVCRQLPQCCLTGWDEPCVNIYSEMSGECPVVL